MRRFSVHFVLFLLLQLGIALSYLWLSPMRDSSITGALIDKHERLLRIPPPRVLFAGGSSLSFGIDGALVRKELRRATVNLALSITLGYEFVLSEIEGSARPGDLVVLSLEQLFLAQNQVEPALSNLLLTLNPRVVRLVPGWSGWKGVLDSSLLSLSKVVRSNWSFRRDWEHGDFPSLMASRLRSSSPYYLAQYPLCPLCTGGPVYTRWSFDGYGDHVAHWNQPAAFDSLAGFDPAVPDSAAAVQGPILEATNELARRLRDRGTELVMVFPPIEERFAASFEAYLKEAESGLRRHAEFPVLGKLEESVYPHSLFYDGPFHLNGVGSKTYTERLIRELAPFVGGSVQEPMDNAALCPPNPVRVFSRWPDDWISGSATLCVYGPCTSGEVDLEIVCAMPTQLRPVEVVALAGDKIAASVTCNAESPVKRIALPVPADGHDFTHFQLRVDRTFRPSETLPNSSDDRDLGVIVRIQD